MILYWDSQFIPIWNPSLESVLFGMRMSPLNFRTISKISINSFVLSPRTNQRNNQVSECRIHQINLVFSNRFKASVMKLRFAVRVFYFPIIRTMKILLINIYFARKSRKILFDYSTASV